MTWILALALLPWSPGEPVAADEVDLSPARWPEGELEELARLTDTFGGQNQLATSDSGVVTGTTGALAVRAGLEALRQGGSAADAALTTSLTQIALAAGAWVSYAGILTMVCYDAASGEVLSLNAGYQTVLGEDDPLSIPGSAIAPGIGGDAGPSGRTALVPGYMAGVGAAHRLLGKLPFETLFAPAIYFAEEGFVLTAIHEAMITRRESVLGRLPETRAIFTDDEGRFPRAGERFRQPQLAATLRAVAVEGPQYMYTGVWAKRFVELVNREGGKMSAEDLAGYAATWSEPQRVSYGGFDVLAPAIPAQGGVHVAEALGVMDQADFGEMGHYSESARAFFWLSQITNLMVLSHIEPAIAAVLLKGVDLSPEGRTSAEHAATMWKRLENGRFLLTQVPRDDPRHSDAVVAIDGDGNVVALCHTINTASWGETGLFVDGVSIPDSASFQQPLIALTGPGRRLPDPTEPLLVMKDGAPWAALSSIGSGLHQKTISVLSNLIDHEMDIKEAVDAPSMHMHAYDPLGRSKPQVFAGDFSQELLDELAAMGLDAVVLANELEERAPRGYVVGALIDPETGERRAVATDVLNARALGQ